MSYPSWQQKVREAQAKYEAQLAAARKEREEEKQAELQKQINKFRADLAQVGIDLPESDSGEWDLDGFHLSMRKSRVYSLGYDVWIGVSAAIKFPFEVDEDVEFELYDRGYQQWAYRVIEIDLKAVLSTAAEIADAFDDLPGEAEKQRERNLQVALEWVRDDEAEGDLSALTVDAVSSPDPSPLDGEGNGSNEALMRELLGYVREIAEAARVLAGVVK